VRHRIIRADQTDLEVLSQVIAEAFCELAPSLWLVADPAERRAIFPGYFGLSVEQALAGGVVHTTVDRDAVALWLPGGPDAPDGPADYEARLAAVTGELLVGRFRAFDTALQSRHPADLEHWHLAILAVRPDRQGQGLGTALLGAYHPVLDRAGVPAYLEASDLRTRRLYLRYGYVDFGPPLMLTSGLMIHPMLRQPRQGPGSVAPARPRHVVRPAAQT
jgi:GNAT superfamily N-acetyltransferase